MTTYTDRKVYEHISTQTKDPILEWKTCRVSGQVFPIYQTDLDFYNKISPTFETTQEIGDKLITKFPNHYSRTDDNKLRVQVPTPTLCPEERQRRRMLFRNERKLYSNRCNATREQIISMYNPNTPYTVYNQCYWWSDDRDAHKYGSAVSLSQSFSNQYHSLLLNIPRIAIMNDDGLGSSENCGYCNDFSLGKNCYIVTCSRHVEDSMYSDCILQSNNLIDCTMLNDKCDTVYQGINCNNVQFSHYMQDSINSHHCWFGSSLNGCSYCFGCVGLNNKQYHIYNKSYSRDSYVKTIKNLLERGYDICKNEFDAFKKEQIVECSVHRNSDNSTGNNIINSPDTFLGFDVFDSKNTRYCTRINSHASDCMDTYQSGSPQLSYENMTSDTSYACSFVTWCWEKSKYLHYCDNCHTSEYLFGCVGLRNKQYCIFNKQYTKEQRHSIVPQLIARMIHDGEWGEFFDPSLSPFGYNETVAQEYFPLTKEEALARGYKRSDYSSDPVIPEGVQTLQGDSVPSDISTVTDDILKQVILCEVSERPFMIQKMELDFYRKHNLPLPTKHPDVRHEERMKLRPGRTLYLRTCDKCGEEMLSVYVKDSSTSSEGQQKVYCEKCYQQEVFG